MKSLALIVLAVVLAGCASQSGAPKVVQGASPAQQEALLGRVKQLEGKWAMKGPDGSTHVASEFAVSSGGSVVREIMFPGHPHEMTNLYHMDGPDIVMTHYCAVGNQPRMRAGSMQGNRLVFSFESVTNYTGGDQHCMRDMAIEFKDADTIVEHWRSFIGDKPVPDETRFELTRVK
jgi:hypothetical protein